MKHLVKGVSHERNSGLEMADGFTGFRPARNSSKPGFGDRLLSCNLFIMYDFARLALFLMAAALLAARSPHSVPGRWTIRCGFSVAPEVPGVSVAGPRASVRIRAGRW
jgi:hypothetical protein